MAVETMGCLEKTFMNIGEVCEKRMSKLFPASIPDFARERLDQEFRHFSVSPVMEDFELYRLISHAVNEAGMHMTIQGTAAGSMITYLVGHTNINPLPGYYYCPKCGSYEVIKKPVFGTDLTDRLCPECAASMDHDGFNIEIPFIWGIHGDRAPYFEYRVSEDVCQLIKGMLEELYPESKVYPWGQYSFLTGSDKKNVIPEGFAILPPKSEYDSFPEFAGYIDPGVPGIVGDRYELGRKHIKSIIVHDDSLEDMISELRHKTGISPDIMDQSAAAKITWKEYIDAGYLSDAEARLFEAFAPVTLKEKTEIIAAGHNIYRQSSEEASLSGYEDEIVIKAACFAEYPCFTRETIFEAYKEIGLSTKEAFVLTEMVRRGISGTSAGHWMNTRWKKRIADHPEIPEALIKVSERYRYATTRVIALNHLYKLGMISCYKTV